MSAVIGIICDSCSVFATMDVRKNIALLRYTLSQKGWRHSLNGKDTCPVCMKKKSEPKEEKP